MNDNGHQLESESAPSSSERVRKQVADYQRFAGRRANLLTRTKRDHHFDDPRQRERKDQQNPVARVEHGGE